ncbi:hypothetical protein OB13_18505 [Pontibacter sp. HJ8]
MVLSFSFLFTACDDDDDTEPTKTDLVVAHEWKGERILVNGLDVSSRPEIKSMLLDIKSTVLTLRRDGTYTAVYDQNGSSQTATGSWSFKENETILFIDLLGDLQLKTLTNSNMDLIRTVQQNGVSFDAEVQFVQ